MLCCVREMIPHFHAAGHLPYAKSARLYLQQMEAFDQTMPEDEYRLFTEKGYTLLSVVLIHSGVEISPIRRLNSS